MEVNNKNNGFTLVEILVVIVIIMILTLVALPYFLQAGKQFALSRSAHKLAQDIRKVQEMGMSAKEFKGSIPEGGYGIFYNTSFDSAFLPPVSNNSYIVFADSNNDLRCDYGTEKIEEILLERGVIIQSLAFVLVTFKPPNPTIGFWPTSSFEITLALDTDPSKTRTITVNEAGLIKIQ